MHRDDAFMNEVFARGIYPKLGHDFHKLCHKYMLHLVISTYFSKNTSPIRLLSYNNENE